MSLFNCAPLNETKTKERTCVFAGLGNCRDHVSKFICNNHAQIFGLIYKPVHYTDGDNEMFSQIVTYTCSVSNLSIPLFIDEFGKVLLNEVYAFANNVSHNNPNINAEDLSTVIACNLGLSVLEDLTKLGGWIEEPGSQIVIHDVATGQLRYTQDVPRLHRILFHYTIPSMTVNESAGSHVRFVDNICLSRCPASGTYKFMLLNKQNILKFTNAPNCVATPLVMSATQKIMPASQERTIRMVTNRFHRV